MITAVARTWRRRPPVTIRLRLTALYGGLFVLVGAGMVAITYGLFTHALGVRPKIGAPALRVRPRLRVPATDPAYQFRDQLAHAVAVQRAEEVQQLLVQSAIALAIASVLAVALGWVLSGRALRPLRDITATARRLSTHNLDERINLAGPRDEMRELADTFDAMLTRLAGAFEAQRRFVANASHELRTPLTSQRAAVDVALADPEPTVESLRAMAVRVRAATERHEHLVESLLTLARSERGVERYVEVDLAETVRDALFAAGSAIDEAGLRVTGDAGAAVVHGDAALLERLAANLVDNAVRHNVPGGWIEVRTGRAGGAAQVRVANSGPVLPPETVPLLFEPFRRHAPGHVRGHGLGLSIVAAITAAHRGTYAARALPDGGLEVTVALPVARAAVTASARRGGSG